MGRKIPAKKHRGVKDPVKQQEQRLKKLKDKIDAPPTDPDEQPVPRSLLRLFGRDTPRPAPPQPPQRPRPRSPPHERSKHRGPSSASNGNANPVSKLRRLPGESARAFSLRINSAVRSLNDDDHVDYSMTLDENEDEDVKGAAMRQRNERRARKGGRGRGKGKGIGGGEEGEGGEKKARAHALTLKKKAKKEKLQQEQSAARAELVYERVSFGDVARAPPALTARPRRAPLRPAAPRPGQRDLLLHAVLSGAAPAAPSGRPSPSPATPSAPSPRLRALPPAERMRRERARLLAVDAYRALKKHPTRI